MKAEDWTNLFKKFAQTGREATVLHAPGDRMESRRYVIRFDVKRKGARPETLECIESDLLPVKGD